MKILLENLLRNEDGKSTIRRYGESVENDKYVQNELNCYDPWAPDLPDDQPVRTIENSQRAAFYRSSSQNYYFKIEEML